MEENNEVWIRSKTANGSDLAACFLPDKGMNFISYWKDHIEVIDQSTRLLFEERFAGLGALIGPHFYHRTIIPPLKDETRFPHIARVKAQGGDEPFSHGIGRYAPWKIEARGDAFIKCILKGEDQWNGVALQELEGQNFTMRYDAFMKPNGLEITLSVVSSTDSVVGLHTYYVLPPKSILTARVQNTRRDQQGWNPFPTDWNYSNDHVLTIPFDEATDLDFGFRPFPDLTQGLIRLDTEKFKLQVTYMCANEENSFQIWHPKGSSFVCIEPLSAKDPRKPVLSVSSLKILISIL